MLQEPAAEVPVVAGHVVQVSPQPVAMPVAYPVAAAAPMQMDREALPMQSEAPPIQSTHEQAAGAQSGGVIFSTEFDALGDSCSNPLVVLRQAVPIQLERAGVTSSEWSAVCDEIEVYQKKSLFNKYRHPPSPATPSAIPSLCACASFMRPLSTHRSMPSQVRPRLLRGSHICHLLLLLRVRAGLHVRLWSRTYPHAPRIPPVHPPPQ